MSILFRLTITIITLSCFTTSALAFSGTIVPSVKVDQAPTIDGANDDKYWDSIKPVLVKDTASGETILLRSVHTDDKVFFSV